MRYLKKAVEIETADAFFFDLGYVPGGYQPARSSTDKLQSPDGGGDGWPGGRVPDDEIWGDGGDDLIDHHDHTEDEVIYTFAGDDVVFLGTGDNTVFAGIGDDEVYGSTGQDLIVGGDGNDSLYGGDNNDEIHAGDGLDIVHGGSGDDFIFLTDDNQMDRVLFDNPGDNDVVDGFETGVDQFEINWAGLSFGDLNISYNGDGTQALVEIDNDTSVIFTGLDGALAEADFFFA